MNTWVTQRAHSESVYWENPALRVDIGIRSNWDFWSLAQGGRVGKSGAGCGATSGIDVSFFENRIGSIPYIWDANFRVMSVTKLTVDTAEPFG